MLYHTLWWRIYIQNSSAPVFISGLDWNIAHLLQPLGWVMFLNFLCGIIQVERERRFSFDGDVENVESDVC